MTIVYKMNAPLRAQDVSDVFRSAGMKRPVDDLERIQRMIDHADATVSAWENEQLIGIARAVTDFSYCCYLSDLAVHLDYQKSGVGTELIARMRDHLGDEVSMVLLSAPAAMEYYPRIGFKKAENAFLIPRGK
ncbi:GNAT family N-acetyltransferase [Paenibacillus sacheonensis]|uniref:GNAT family N-acetyltransferase n=1 Tax=Paenibacillus sacheonensis TaxID=742054 RepID=A0A7X4YPT0_9BACL|nr:GNAT family N-acetyltransferase [Paenibacillus sacheonensis]MBM7564938.1 N-acetylglutamate synthase-like GNAT family acetyltransferase [Paenibacillus sacheonensis]NBC70273.1 GNAT family N-acetyltransferase [Paenibacillus sacheonensis]